MTDNELEAIPTPSITAVPILNDKYLRHDIDTVSVYTAEIISKAAISEISIAISKTYPDMSLIHLKRVKAPSSECTNFRIFIAKADANNHEAIQSFCSSYNLSNLKLQELPAKPALTRVQYIAAIKLWPTNFHENKCISKYLSDSPIEAKELQRIQNIFRELLARSGLNGGYHTGFVYDKKVEIAKASDTKCHHPLQHCAMNLIDEVAYYQGGGAWRSNLSKQFATNLTDQESHQAKSKLPYLCTNYDVFLTEEPCIMCAMALLHSRIKRVFVLDTNDVEFVKGCPCDAPFTRLKLHVSERVNHNFEVWIITLGCSR